MLFDNPKPLYVFESNRGTYKPIAIATVVLMDFSKRSAPLTLFQPLCLFVDMDPLSLTNFHINT